MLRCCFDGARPGFGFARENLHTLQWCAATLDRRVQFLLDPAKYAAFEREASVHKRRGASLIREVTCQLRTGSTRLGLRS